MPNYEEALHPHTPAAAIPGIPKAGTPLSDPLLGQKQGFQQFRTMFSCRVRGRPVFSQIFVCYPPWGPSDPLVCHPQSANRQPRFSKGVGNRVGDGDTRFPHIGHRRRFGVDASSQMVLPRRESGIGTSRRTCLPRLRAIQCHRTRLWVASNRLTLTELLAPDSRRATHLPTPPHHATNSRYPTCTNTPNHAYPRTVQHQPNRANRPPTHTQIKQQATAKERQGKPNTNKTTQRNIGC